MNSLSAKAAAMLATLSAGPATTRELAVAAGYEPDSRAGRDYVTTYIARLERRGYHIANLRRPGSNYGAYYVLVSRPRTRPASEATQGHCPRCGAKRNAWNRDDLCWPCQRSTLDAELAAMHGQLQLELAAVAS